jgi:hypothetical protein
VQPATKPEPKKSPTAIDALAKIQKILNQLDDSERKKVLAFIAG